MSTNTFEREIQALIELKAETRNLDFKESINWKTADKDARGRIVKDILAMSNTQDGGKIIFGVKDGAFELVGMPEEEYESFDITTINDFLHQYSDPKLTCNVLKCKIKGTHCVVVIDVPEYSEVPIVCKKNLDSSDNKGKVLQEGQLYIRTDKGTSETIKTSEMMRSFLNRAITKNGDSLLRRIELLLKGKTTTVEVDVLEKYSNEIRTAKEYFESKFQNPNGHGYWDFMAFPSVFAEKRFSNLKVLKTSVEQSVVSLRGWDFPHIEMSKNGEGSGNFSNGFQSHTDWLTHVEGFRIYQSGLFNLRQLFWEDSEPGINKGKKVISFIMIIYTITEFLLFLKRFYESLSDEETIVIQVALHGCKNRRLASFEPSVFLTGSYISSEDTIEIKKEISIIELKTSFKEIGQEIAQHIFYVYNWEQISSSTIESWQTKLIEKTF